MEKILGTDKMIINMGPQHPSTHGVLRLELEVEGETIVNVAPHIGYLHTGIEKEMESKTYHQGIVLTDRLDYLAAFSNNLAYIMAVEKLLNLDIPKRAQYIRVLLVELNRIASHLVWLATHVLDLGGISMFWYAFREREIILDIFETVSGARMTPSYFRIGGVSADLPEGFGRKVKDFIELFKSRINEYEDLITENPIWINRTKGVGVISQKDAVFLGLSGPLLRATGIKWDIRKSNPYCSYEDFDFEISCGENGDVYDRYLARMFEIRQSLRIVEQALDGMPEGSFIADAPQVVLPSKDKVLTTIEGLIRHFLIVSEGFYPPVGEVYHSIESPKGELGFYIVSDGSNKPYRVKIRPPSFVNLQALAGMAKGRLIADLVAIIGSLDIVLGEIDR